MNRQYNKKIVLEDGAEFYGYNFGENREVIAEVVFNTSMVGYQEILSDPSYTGQAVVMTYPLIGNYGMCKDDYETDRPTVSAIIVREYNGEPSNFRAAETLEQVMCKFGIVGIAGVDTRALARHIRDKGTGKALLTDAAFPNIAAVARLQTLRLPEDQVARVSTPKAWAASCENSRFHVAAIDCGILLDGEPMEVILDIQTVLLIGIVAEEREEDTLPDPQGTYERCRARTQVIGDYYEEIQYLLQPQYKHYLKKGMEILWLS